MLYIFAHTPQDKLKLQDKHRFKVINKKQYVTISIRYNIDHTQVVIQYCIAIRECASDLTHTHPNSYPYVITTIKHWKGCFIS